MDHSDMHRRAATTRAGLLPTVLLTLVTTSACSFLSSQEQQLSSNVFPFIAAVEQHQATLAFDLLSHDARTKIDPGRLAAANGDVQQIIAEFRRAGVTTRAPKPKHEPDIYVSNLGGREGVVRFVLVQEHGRWKIANVLAGPATPPAP